MTVFDTLDTTSQRSRIKSDRPRPDPLLPPHSARNRVADDAASRNASVSSLSDTTASASTVTAEVLPVDTATLIGAVLRLGRRPLYPAEQARLIAQLSDRANAGDPTARLALDWLVCRIWLDAHPATNTEDPACRHGRGRSHTEA